MQQTDSVRKRSLSDLFRVNTLVIHLGPMKIESVVLNCIPKFNPKYLYNATLLVVGVLVYSGAVVSGGTLMIPSAILSHFYSGHLSVMYEVGLSEFIYGAIFSLACLCVAISTCMLRTLSLEAISLLLGMILWAFMAPIMLS